jgi:hypothetical protein
MLGSPDTIGSISAGTDPSGLAAVFVLTADTSLTEWSTSNGWLQAPIGGPGTILTMSAASNDRVAVVTADHSVFEHDDHLGWFALTSSNFAKSVSAITDGSGHVVVFAVTLDSALFRYEEAAGWSKLGGSGTIDAVSAGLDAGGQAKVAVLTTSGDVADNDPLTGWSVSTPPGPLAELSAATADRLFATLSDGSVFGHDDQGWFRLSSPAFASAL